jgi:hypothetical protein
MEQPKSPAEKAKAYAELSKLKRKVLAAINDHADKADILVEISACGYTEKESEKLYLQVQLEKVEDRIRKIWTTLMVLSLIAIVASYIIYLVPNGEGQGAKGFSYLIGMIILPFLAVIYQITNIIEKKGLVYELKKITDVIENNA